MEKGHDYGADDENAAADLRLYCRDDTASGLSALRAGDRRGGGAEVDHRGAPTLTAGRLPGDFVAVHQQPTAYNGEIVVALLGDEATVKRLSRRNGQVWLLPENENYQPIDGREATLLGKVTAVIRQYS